MRYRNSDRETVENLACDYLGKLAARCAVQPDWRAGLTVGLSILLSQCEHILVGIVCDLLGQHFVSSIMELPPSDHKARVVDAIPLRRPARKPDWFAPAGSVSSPARRMNSIASHRPGVGRLMSSGSGLRPILPTHEAVSTRVDDYVENWPKGRVAERRHIGHSRPD